MVFVTLQNPHDQLSAGCFSGKVLHLPRLLSHPISNVKIHIVNECGLLTGGESPSISLLYYSDHLELYFGETHLSRATWFLSEYNVEEDSMLTAVLSGLDDDTDRAIRTPARRAMEMALCMTMYTHEDSYGYCNVPVLPLWGGLHTVQ